MPLIKKKRSSNKTATPINITFSIALNEDERVQFNPNKAFNHITTAQVLKIIQKADIEVTRENSKGYVNFKLSTNTSTFGFINFYENDLDDESTSEEQTEYVMALEKDLSTITVEDIALPMNADEADALIDNL
jgi:hypothetical protein